LWSKPRYWVDEKEGRQAVLNRQIDTGQALDYQGYRVGHRAIASSTNERTMIATGLLPNVFFGHSINATRNSIEAQDILLITDLLNSFTLDFSLRQRVSANLTMFYLYQLPVPRLTEQSPLYKVIVERSAKLICTTSEYQTLWDAVLPAIPWSPDVVAISQAERATLRAELDGIIAHLYGLTEEEFRHILDTFPLIKQSIKDATLAAYQEFTHEHEAVPQM